MKKEIFLLRNLKYGGEDVSMHDLGASEYALDYVTIGKGVCEFDMIPDDDQVAAAVKSLQEAKRREMAESQVRLNKIDEQIQSMLAITHSK